MTLIFSNLSSYRVFRATQPSRLLFEPKCGRTCCSFCWFRPHRSHDQVAALRVLRLDVAWSSPSMGDKSGSPIRSFCCDRFPCQLGEVSLVSGSRLQWTSLQPFGLTGDLEARGQRPKDSKQGFVSNQNRWSFWLFSSRSRVAYVH